MGRPDFRIRRGNRQACLMSLERRETFRHDIAGGWRQREGMFMGGARYRGHGSGLVPVPMTSTRGSRLTGRDDPDPVTSRLA